METLGPGLSDLAPNPIVQVLGNARSDAGNGQNSWSSRAIPANASK
jgi:hypothetical protein